ncbi:tRNA (adenosine(37)-N6)-threonylcarbamoyltransferase complex dimerization subunit type 1 TsaB [Acetobacter sp.]|uniref:tRNA (adenosine(37)-N6)-threonylcarbamoyltransferase complex dimerization subunit type 1 TsaB n=1 Tax=Acetobacter sp. TaxID=440 RepID=UPI0039EBE8F6
MTGLDRPLRIMVLDAAPAEVQARVAAVMHDGRTGDVLASREMPGHDGIGSMAGLLEECLSEVEWLAPELVVVVVGPGSFTGLRTACSLAAGLAFGAECPVVGVTRGEALAPLLEPVVKEQGLSGWLSVNVARRGRWFVESSASSGEELSAVVAVKSEEWQSPLGTWVVAGDAAEQAMQGRERMCIAPVTGEAPVQDIALTGLRRHLGNLAPRAAVPLYVDPPEAKLPAGGLRSRPE